MTIESHTMISSADLDDVRGGFDAAKCFADTAAGAAAGAATGGSSPRSRAISGAVWGAEAAATSANCGDGTRSPAAMLGDAVKSIATPSPDYQVPPEINLAP